MRHVSSGTIYTDVEMQLVNPLIGLPNEPASHPMHIKTTRTSFIGADVFIENVEMRPMLTTDSFRDTANALIEQNKASFSAKNTALSIAGATPSILKELSHHIPGLGAVLSSTYFADDIRSLNHIRKRMIFTKNFIDDYFEDPWKKHIVSFETSIAIGRVFENTILYALSQLERRYNKQANSIVGRAFQVMGSSLTFAGLFTHGATVPLGLGCGGVGSIIRARFAIRSAYNNIRRRIAGTLSVNREQHARHLYGLTLLHLLNTGKHDGNYVGSKEAGRSVQFAREVNPNHRTDEEEVAAEFVASIEGLEYIGAETPIQTQLDHFLEYGLWSIMLGIKS